MPADDLRGIAKWMVKQRCPEQSERESELSFAGQGAFKPPPLTGAERRGK